MHGSMRQTDTTRRKQEGRLLAQLQRICRLQDESGSNSLSRRNAIRFFCIKIMLHERIHRYMLNADQVNNVVVIYYVFVYNCFISFVN